MSDDTRFGSLVVIEINSMSKKKTATPNRNSEGLGLQKSDLLLTFTSEELPKSLETASHGLNSGRCRSTSVSWFVRDLRRRSLN